MNRAALRRTETMNCRQKTLQNLSFHNINEFQTESGLALRLRELIEDPESTTEEIVSLLARTPAISRHILRRANNKAFSPPVENLHDAIVKLGVAQLYEIVGNFQMDKTSTSPPSAYRPKAY